MDKRASDYACPDCGSFMQRYPEMPELWLKCPSCGFTRPTLKNTSKDKKPIYKHK